MCRSQAIRMVYSVVHEFSEWPLKCCVLRSWPGMGIFGFIATWKISLLFLIGRSFGWRCIARSFVSFRICSRNRFQLNSFRTPFAEPMHERGTLRKRNIYTFILYTSPLQTVILDFVYYSGRANHFETISVYQVSRRTDEILWKWNILMLVFCSSSLFFFKWPSVLFTQMRCSNLFKTCLIALRLYARKIIANVSLLLEYFFRHLLRRRTFRAVNIISHSWSSLRLLNSYAVE